jgi:hypothetical protein
MSFLTPPAWFTQRQEARRARKAAEAAALEEARRKAQSEMVLRTQIATDKFTKLGGVFTEFSYAVPEDPDSPRAVGYFLLAHCLYRVVATPDGFSVARV